MVVLDNLVVTTALPSIRTDLGGGLEDLQWTVNAYTLAFAVLLMTGAALGDRFGRRRVFSIGVGVFTLGSVAAAVAPNVELLNLARGLQGLGGAIVMPLTLTILSHAVPKEKRGHALGAWGGGEPSGVVLRNWCENQPVSPSTVPLTKPFCDSPVSSMAVPFGITRAIVLSKALNDPELMGKQTRQYRNYIKLLFGA